MEHYADLDVSRVDANPFQPRTAFDEDDLADLIASIADLGVLQPVLVRPSGDRYQLVAGERRLRASIAAGRATIPAVIRDTSDLEMRRLAIVENVQRADLNLLEEAHAVRALIEEAHCTQAQAAELLGKSRAHVSHLLGILRLPEPVQRRVAAGVLSLGHAKVLMGISDPDQAAALADRIVAEGLSVRSTEEIVLLGDLPKQRSARAPRARSSRSSLPQIENGLAAWLDTRVSVTAGRGRGRIVLEFADLTDLDRLLAAMAVPLALLEQQQE